MEERQSRRFSEPWSHLLGCSRGLRGLPFTMGFSFRLAPHASHELPHFLLVFDTPPQSTSSLPQRAD